MKRIIVFGVCLLVKFALASTISVSIKYDGPWQWNDLDVEMTTETGDDGYPVIVKYTGTIEIAGYRDEVTELEIPEKITWRGESWGVAVVTYDYDVVAIAENAFNGYWSSGYKKLESVTIPDTVTKIKSLAFYESGIKSVVIPNSVTEIGNDCFAYCSSLRSVVLPNNIAVLPNACFNGCTSLTEVTIPNSVTEIGLGCFYNCASLRTAVLPNDIAALPPYLFDGCTSLSEVTIPMSVREIGERAFTSTAIPAVNLSANCRSLGSEAFSSCFNLKQVTVENISRIDRSHFARCTNIEELVLGDGVRDVGELAFNDSSWKYGLRKLRHLALGNNITNIGNEAFYGSGSAQDAPYMSVSIPRSVQSIGRYAFARMYNVTNLVIQGVDTAGCYNYEFDSMTNLISLTVGEGVEKIVGGWSQSPRLRRVRLEGSTLREIGEWVFRDHERLEEVELSANLEEIGSEAFARCISLKDIHVVDAKYTIPKTLTKYEEAFAHLPITNKVEFEEGCSTICAKAFLDCTNIPSVFVPKSVVSVGISAFESCDALTNVVLESGLTVLGDSMFEFCDRLKNVKIPASIETCGQYVFYGCSALTNVELEIGLKTIGTGMFTSCTGLGNIQIPSSVETIGAGAFSSCSSLRDVAIPGSVKSIGGSAFGSCRGLLDVVVEDGVPLLSNGMFDSCSSLRSVSLPNSVAMIGSTTFRSCTSLQKVTIPCGVQQLGYRSFYGCTGLTTVSLSEGLAEIGESVFQGCVGLRAMSFPESLTTIGNTAFSGCTSLSTVSFPSGVDEVGIGAFSGCSVKSMLFNNANGEFLDQFSKESLRTLFLGKDADGISGELLSDCSALETIMTAVANPNYCTDGGVLYDKAKTTLIKYPCASSITAYVVPSTVTDVDVSAFAYTSALSELTFNGNVAALGDAAFDWCLGLRTVTFNGTVDFIGDGAFTVCPSLEALFFKGDSPVWGNSQFWYSTPTVYVEKGTTGWNAAAASAGFVVSYIGGSGSTVPNSWIDQYPSFLAAAGGDYETAANTIGANGVTLRESYVAGLDPTDKNSKFTANITVEDGDPKLTWSPDLSEDATPRSYTTYGKATLDADDEWEIVTDANKSTMKYFKVTVDLP